MDKNLLKVIMDKIVPTAQAASAQMTEPRSLLGGLQAEDVYFRRNNGISSNPPEGADWQQTYYTLPGQQISAVMPGIQRDLNAFDPQGPNTIGSAGGGVFHGEAERNAYMNNFNNWYRSLFQ